MVALAHFSAELLVFRTMSLKGAASPMVVAGECLDWFGWFFGEGSAAIGAGVFFSPGARARALPLQRSSHALPPPLFQKQKTQTNAGLSTLWMSAGWNYYTRDAAGLASPTVSAETAPRPKEREE